MKEHNLDEQFYLLYGGNDLHTVFMTKDQFELMSKINGNDKNEKWYRGNYNAVEQWFTVIELKNLDTIKKIEKEKTAANKG